MEFLKTYLQADFHLVAMMTFMAGLRCCAQCKIRACVVDVQGK